MEQPTIVVNSYEEILKLSKEQFTAQDFLDRQVFTEKKGWVKLEYSSEMRENFSIEISELLGGWEKTKNCIYSFLRYNRVNHWGLQRIMLTERSEGFGWHYCSGQDYPSEIKTIRNFLKK